MKIIANIDGGFLIEATKSEVNEVLSAVHGVVPEDIKIGQKIPAIDYSATIKKLKELPNEYNYKRLKDCAEKFNSMMKELNGVVDKATEI